MFLSVRAWRLNGTRIARRWHLLWNGPPQLLHYYKKQSIERHAYPIIALLASTHGGNFVNSGVWFRTPRLNGSILQPKYARSPASGAWAERCAVSGARCFSVLTYFWLDKACVSVRLGQDCCAKASAPSSIQVSLMHGTCALLPYMYNHDALRLFVCIITKLIRQQINNT